MLSNGTNRGGEEEDGGGSGSPLTAAIHITETNPEHMA